MSEFVTFRRSDPRLKQYLAGDVEPGLLAIPVETLMLDDGQEITFRLVRESEIPKVSPFRVWAQAARLELLTLTLTPAATVWAVSAPPWSSALWGALALFSLFFLHCGILGLNDVNDHLSGIDRINEKGGSRVIQNGWISARSLKRLSYCQLLVGAGLGAPIVAVQPEVGLLVAVSALFAFIGGTHSRWGYNKIFLSTEIAVFSTLGPLLAWGMEWILLGSFTFKAGLLGVTFGFLALGYLGARQLVSAVVDDQAGLQTLPVNIGFDRARFWFAGWILTGLIIATWLFGPVMAAPLAFALWTSWRLSRVRSPLSSDLNDLPQVLLLLHVLTGIAVVIASEVGARL